MTEIYCAKYIVKNILVFSLKSESKQFSFVPTSQREMGDLKKKEEKSTNCAIRFIGLGIPFHIFVIRSLKFDNLFSRIALALVPVIYTIRSLD